MRIGIDLRMAGGGSGIDRYISELTHSILSLSASGGKKNQYVLFFRRADESADYKKYNQKIIIADIPHYSVAEQIKFPKILNAEKLDLMHFPHFNVPIFYTKPFVVTIHDLTHTLFPGKKKSHFFHRLAYHLVFNNAIRKSKKIIAVSASTKSQILENFSISPDKIQVIYEGFNSAYKMMDKEEAFAKVSNRFRILKPYILYVGVWRRYKNLPMLAKAFDRIKGKFDMQLVLAGAEDPNYPEIRDQVLSIKYKGDVITPGRVSDEELNLLYNGATLFVLPSLMEGFGLTALEAAATGIPISCSDIGALREVLGQAGEYFDPNNLDNMTEVISSVLGRPEKLEEMSNLSLKRSKVFSWKQAGEETIGLYESLAKISNF